MMTTVPPMTASAPVPMPMPRDQAQHLARVAPDGVGGGPQRLAVEGGLLPQRADAADGLLQPRSTRDGRRLCGHGATFTPNAVARMLIRNSAMKANTTVSLTALPTAVGPPPTCSPL